MHPITPCLWFDDQAEEAVNFYVSAFGNGAAGKTLRYSEANARLSGRSVGSVLTMEFKVAGFPFTALNGGPLFKPNPSISFIVQCPTKDAVDALWARMAEGGTPLMPLDSYPFSERYGWIQDKFGVSWQLIYTPDARAQLIRPSLMFVGPQCGRAEEAMNRYAEVFDNSAVGEIFRYGADQAPDSEGTVMYGEFTLNGQKFAAMDSAHQHEFNFSEGISLQVPCDTQAEIDRYWDALSADPEAERCGWLKDPFGVSWQIVPKVLSDYITDPDAAKSGRVMEAMLQMKKLDITALERAHAGA